MSLIHEQGYRRFGGLRNAHRAWLVIARHGTIAMVRQRRFLALLLLAWSPFVVRAVQIYLSARFQQASFLAADAETYRGFLSQQRLFMFFVTVSAGAGLIANDRRANALQIYLSKPITRVEYVGGKLSILLTFLLGITWVPAMLLLLLQVAFAGSLTFLRGNLALIPAITVFAFLQACVAALIMLALSSLSNSSRFVAVMYAAVVFFGATLSTAMRAATGTAVFRWLSPGNSLEVIGDAIFQRPTSADVPLPLAVIAIVTLLLGCLVVLERRVSAVEVVG